ncbi:pentapeptide repeat-containing protein [Dactylosporangium sp. NPDC000555]|uniref:pentapeptide repeat-containing protein n=1 Tax=Dactylosporangium sp. NPDC000555 TaxID=3154260 RepID=UPI0033277A23
MPTQSVLPMAHTAPARPRPPTTLVLATLDEDDLRDDATYKALGFYDLALAGRTAKGAEFVQCRFKRADLTGTALTGSILTDCLIEDTSLAEVRADQSVMHRVTVRDSWLTGLQWLDGTLHDVTVRDCLAERSVFRGAHLHAVTFTGTDLTGADFTGADLSGAAFIDCDLSGARFDFAISAGARLEGCTLDGIGGAAGLAGATIATDDPVGLSRVLAVALDITLENA